MTGSLGILNESELQKTCAGSMENVGRLAITALLFVTLVAVGTLEASAGERRIIAAGGAITEILYRIGRAQDVVGVDTTSRFPPQALREKAQVGYVRALGAEGLLSLRPTTILAIDGAGPPEALRVARQAGVDVITIPDEFTPAGVQDRILKVAKAADALAEGERLADTVRSGFDELAALRGWIKDRKRVLVVLSLQNGRPLVAGQGTTGAAILSLAGADNAASSLQGWKPLSDEGVISAAPDVVVMIDRGPDALQGDPFALPALAATPAGARRALVRLDSLYLLGFGPRTPSAASELMRGIYPDLASRAR